jgi:putative FmdB family regulatory protein
MPLYDLECEKCGEEFEAFSKIVERDEVRCPKCGGETKILICSSKQRDWFREGWYEEFDLHPIYVKSKGHMKELCLKYDVTSRALGDIRNIKEI